MRVKDETKFKVIADEIKRFMIVRGRIPTQRELSNKVGLGKTAIYRYLKTMKEKGLIEGSGKEIFTKETQLISIPMVDSLYNSKHEYETANIEDFIFVSRRIYGEGQFGLVRMIDDSMSKSNINPNNFMIVRRQQNAEIGQIVLVKSKDKYFLRRLIYDEKQNCQRLISESYTVYEEITQYEIRGAVVTVIVHLDEEIMRRYITHLKL